MNCPTCGAENDADARFCAECGSSLENQAVETAKAEQAFEEAADPDMTIMSMPGDLASEAKTMAVDQDQVNAAVEEAGATVGAEAAPATPEPAPSDSGDDSGSHRQVHVSEGGGNRRMWIIIGVVAVVILLCCCCSLAVGGVLGSDPDAFEEMLEELSLVVMHLPLV